MLTDSRQTHCRFPMLLSRLSIGFMLAAILAGCGASDEPAEPGDRTILVTGATGTQGGAVARELLDRGYVVRALTRSPDKPAAAELRELGAIVVKGDFDDRASLLDAMRGVHGVFAVTDTWEHGAEREIAHGSQLITAAEESGVGHFVYTSVAGADQATGLPHFDSKHEIEKRLASSGLDFTVVRPVEFMNNWRYIWQDLQDGRYVNPRDGSDHHQWIAASDIGFFVAEAFDRPAAWTGRTLEIAGDEMAIEGLVALLSEVLDRPVAHVQPTWPEFRAAAGDEMAEMYRWFAETGYDVDITALRQQYPDLTTARTFLERMAAETPAAP